MTTANLNADAKLKSDLRPPSPDAAARATRRKGEPGVLWQLLRPFSSLRLTVVLLFLAFVVIFAGTWAQRFADVWHVQNQYFHTWGFLIEARIFLPEQAPQGGILKVIDQVIRRVRIPMVGGYTLIVLMLVNLIAAHATRFNFKKGDIALLPLLAAMLFVPQWLIPNAPTGWLSATLGGVPVVTMLAYTPLLALFAAAVAWLHGKRTGIILTHVALIILLAGEMVTSQFAVESRMAIEEGQTVNWSADIREAELVVIDPSHSADADKVVAVPKGWLQEGAVIRDPALPFEIKIDEYYRNAGLLGPAQARQRNVPDRATAGEFKGQVVAVEQPGVSGVGSEASQVDMPAAYVTLSAGGKPLGTYLLSVGPDRPQTVEVDGKAYQIALRFRRYYRPFSLHLKDFAFDRYPGTNVPRNYSSDARLIDPSKGVDRDVLIWMNHPLRYGGETFFQSGFNEQTERGTVLQVVKNPGERFPYIACALGAIGLVVHFGITLIRFIGRSRTPAPYVAPVAAAAPGKGKGKGGRGAKGDGRGGTSYTLEPRAPRTLAGVLVPTAVVLLCAFYLLSLFARPERNKGPYDLNAFGQVPISYEGRQQPLDSLARNAMKVMSGKSTLGIEVENPSAFRRMMGMTTTKRPATQWLLDLWSRAERANDYKVIRIDLEEIRRLIAPPNDPDKQKEFADRKMFSFNEIIARQDELQKQFQQMASVKPADRDLFQSKLAELGEKLNVYVALDNFFGLYLAPPAADGGEWQRLGPALEQAGRTGTRDPAVESFRQVLQGAVNDKPEEFNAAVASHLGRLDARLPATMAKVRSEVVFNRVDPFYRATIFYVLVFLLVAFSWLLADTSRALYRSAWWVLLLTLVFHTAALGWRVYLSGRPPVTNLYSSAIFIAWGAALLAAGLEFFFRNGIGILTAAVIGFLSLVVAINLAGDGDTMKVLQAVLDTNFWLATHVVVIVLGYAATFLAGILGAVYVVGGLFTPALNRGRGDTAKVLARMVYGILCFALLFSFIGTVLGGIWADQSWGRFWGWDPKENGAALIVLWNAIVLHCRWGGIVRERGLMNLAIFGNVVTAWSWFGTNMLGIGLHAYGFIDSAVFWLMLFCVSQVGLIALGSLPTRLWRSFGGDGGTGGPPPTLPAAA